MGLSRYLAKLGALIGSDGKVPAAGLADGAVTAAKLSSTAIADKLGFTPYKSRIYDDSGNYLQLSASNELELFNSAGVVQDLYLNHSGGANSLHGPSGSTVVTTGNFDQHVAKMPTTYVDPNNAVPSGNSQFQPFLINGSAPSPTGLDGCVIAWTWVSASYASQIYIDIDPTNYYAVRTRNSLGAWQSWRNL